jgi:hypothetical protein
LIFLTIAFAERFGPDKNARLVRSLSVMNFTREPPMSIARVVGRNLRLLVFFAINSHPALPHEHDYSSYAAEIEQQPAPRFCSPSDSILFAKNESESRKSARASS